MKSVALYRQYKAVDDLRRKRGDAWELQKEWFDINQHQVWLYLASYSALLVRSKLLVKYDK